MLAVMGFFSLKEVRLKMQASVKRIDNTAEVLRELQGKQVEFVTVGSTIMQAEARTRAPIDKGNLAASIQRQTFVEDGQAIGEVEATAEYSSYVEYGTGVFNPKGRKTPWSFKLPDGRWVTTRGMPAQPFMAPAWEVMKGRLVSIYKRIFKL